MTNESWQRDACASATEEPSRGAALYVRYGFVFKVKCHHFNNQQPIMRNKTLATLFAATLGFAGAHRFYLYGKRDIWGWVHAASIPLSLFLGAHYFGSTLMATTAPLMLSFLASLLQALLIGLTPDEKWDARYDQSGATQSAWPLALLLVLVTAIGAITLIAILARTFDLLYTGGAYG